MTEFSDVIEILNRLENKVDNQGNTIGDIRVSVQDLCNRTKSLEKGAEEMIQEKIELNNKIKDAEKKKGDNRTRIAVAFIGALSGITSVLGFFGIHR